MSVRRLLKFRFPFGLVLITLLGLLPRPSFCDEAATARNAASVLDLSEFPLVNPVGDPNAMLVAQQSYVAGGTLSEVGKRLQTQLKEAGAEELDGAMFTDSYGSALYRKDAFLFSLTLTPGREDGQVAVNLRNHGDIDLKSLPVLNGMAVQFSLPNMVSYVSETSVETTRENLKNLLKEHGWELFGDTQVSFYVKRNAVIVQVVVMAAPALEGKTMVQLTGEQMSVDLPTPPYDGLLQYSDGSGGLLFDSKQSKEQIIEFFKESLGNVGWKNTTENPVKIGFREHLIFRNPEKEYLEMDFQKVEGMTRTRITFQNAKQFAESERKAQEVIASKRKEQDERMERLKNPEKIEIALPKNSKLVESGKNGLELSVATGTAKDTVSKWAKQFEEKGWKVQRTIDQKLVGDYSLTKGDVKFSVGFTDPGFIPGSIILRTDAGYQFEVKEQVE